MDAVKTYTLLTKPGIVMGNVIAIAGGFALGVQDKMPWAVFIATMLGLSLLIASSCILNNFIDRRIDALMERTKKRAFVLGLVKPERAFLLSAILGSFGLFLLISFTNVLTVCLALFGYVTYIILYGIFKRRTRYGTLIGSLAGAVPPVVGYCAATNRFDLGAALLFSILIVWQMPHFFAISLYRMGDYKKAGIPVHPLKKGVRNTQVQMLLYVLLFAALGFALVPLAGLRFAIILTALCLYWLFTAIKGFSNKDYESWARQMFFASLWVICGLFGTLIFVS